MHAENDNGATLSSAFDRSLLGSTPVVLPKGRRIPVGERGHFELPRDTLVFMGVNSRDVELFLAQVGNDKKSFSCHGEKSEEAMLAAVRKHYRLE